MGLGAQIVEVLEPESYQMGHLPGAMNIPLHLLATESRRLEASRPVVVYCNNYG